MYFISNHEIIRRERRYVIKKNCRSDFHKGDLIRVYIYTYVHYMSRGSTILLKYIGILYQVHNVL